MKQFLDFTGLGYFLDKLKTIFVKDISEGSTSGAFQYKTYEEVDDPEHQGQKKLQEKIVSVPVHNVVTTDTEQTISGAKTFTGTVKVPDIADGATDTGLAANKGYVDSKITENDAMSYKGAVYPNSDETEGHAHLPFAGTTKSQYKVGATFKTAAEGTYYTAEGGGEGKQQVARIGDLFIVKSVASSSPYTLTYDYIPAADDVTSVQYSSDGTGINVGTSATYGQAIFGEAAVKPVDTSITAGTSSTNVPTSAAVATYAISGVTAGDNSVTIGTKSGGTQSVAVKVKANSGIAVDSNGIYANIDETAGLTFDNNGKLKIKTGAGLQFTDDGSLKPFIGPGLQFGSTLVDPISVCLLENGGLEFYDTGISSLIKVDYSTVGNQLAGNGLTYSNDALNVNTGDGLEIDDDTGELKVKAYSANSGLEVDDSGVRVVADTNNGLEITGCGIGIKLAEDTSGAEPIPASGLEFTNDGKLQVKTGSSLIINGSSGALNINVDPNNANGLSIEGGSGLALDLATPSVNGEGGSAGAMSAEDKEKLDNLGTNYADKLDVETGSTTGTVDLKLKNSSAGTLDTVTITSANKAISVAASGTAGTSAATTLTVTANVDTTTGLQVDSTNGIQINNGNGTQFNGTSGAIEVKAYNGITVDSNGVSAKIDSTNNTGGLDFDANGNIEVVSIGNDDIDTLFV